MRFSINLATRTYLDQRLVKRVIALILAMLLVTLVWNISRNASSLKELGRLRADITTFENKLNSRPGGVSEKEYMKLLDRITFFNKVIEQKSFSWLGLLDQMEAATTDGIALSALAPDLKTGLLKIDGRARNFAQIKVFLDKLEESKAFTEVMLISHAIIDVGEKTRGFQFSITCKAILK